LAIKSLELTTILYSHEIWEGPCMDALLPSRLLTFIPEIPVATTGWDTRETVLCNRPQSFISHPPPFQFTYIKLNPFHSTLDTSAFYTYST
jgi:hypothetical protein